MGKRPSSPPLQQGMPQIMNPRVDAQPYASDVFCRQQISYFVTHVTDVLRAFSVFFDKNALKAPPLNIMAVYVLVQYDGNHLMRLY